jgi:predicted extracellular nuclease
MKYATLIVLVFHSFVHALDFRVASYNVENLFDLTNNGTEYEEYIPNTKYWHQKAYTNKLENIKRVLIDLDAEIVSLQEIESQEALNDLLKLLPKYKYSQFIKKKNSAIGLALISKYKINSYKTITVDNSNDRERDILKTNILIDNKEIIIYTNHWRSKRSKENYRILYAKALLDEIKLNTKDLDYIIIGDLNSNYNEFQTFKREKKLNNTYNITGINHVLNTTLHGNFINKQTIQIYNEIVHYNTWLDLELKNRFSSIYRKANTTPDNILLSKALFDTKNITYKDNSLEVFKPIYLFNN